MSQPGPSIWNHLKSNAFNIPHSGFSIQRKDRIVGIEGMAHAIRNRTESQRIQAFSCRKKAESASASSIFTLTATSRKTIVLTIVEANTGSSKSLRYAEGLEPSQMPYRTGKTTNSAKTAKYGTSSTIPQKVSSERPFFGGACAGAGSTTLTSDVRGTGAAARRPRGIRATARGFV